MSRNQICYEIKRYTRCTECKNLHMSPLLVAWALTLSYHWASLGEVAYIMWEEFYFVSHF